MPRGQGQVDTVGRRATLNDALDTMLVSSQGCAVVTGRGDEFLGLVSVESVMHAIQSARDTAREQNVGITGRTVPASEAGT